MATETRYQVQFRYASWPAGRWQNAHTWRSRTDAEVQADSMFGPTRRRSDGRVARRLTRVVEVQVSVDQHWAAQL